MFAFFASKEQRLYDAAEKGQLSEVMEYINEANINYKDKNGNTALMKASMNGHRAIVDTLISHKADINIQNKYGETAFMLSCGWEHIDIAVSLIEAGCDCSLRTIKANNSGIDFLRNLDHFHIVKVTLNLLLCFSRLFVYCYL